jgi:hypothetical protein
VEKLRRGLVFQRVVWLNSTSTCPQEKRVLWEDIVLTIPPLGLDSYQTKAIRTDRTRKSGAELDLTVLGLVGETGSLLSEVKKKQRDSRSYLGYEDAVTEEMGASSSSLILTLCRIYGGHRSSSSVGKFRCRADGVLRLKPDQHLFKQREIISLEQGSKFPFASSNAGVNGGAVSHSRCHWRRRFLLASELNPALQRPLSVSVSISAEI